MEEIFADNISQLKTALDQIRMNDRNSDRFAFLLVDNVIELTLHQFAMQKKVNFQESFNRNREILDFYNNHLSSEERQGRLFNRTVRIDKELAVLLDIIRKARGREFDNKVKACSKLDLLDDELKDSIIYLHGFRNTAYHQGLRHEGILHSLAVFYFECACILIKNTESQLNANDMRKISSKPSSASIETDIFEALSFGSLGDVKRIHPAPSELLRALKAQDQSLVVDLVLDMRSTIEKYDELLNCELNSSAETRKKTLIESQIWPILFSDEVEKLIKESAIVDQSLGERIEWLSENFKKLDSKGNLVQVDPVVSWKKRLKSLQREENRHSALKKYCDFMRQTSDLRDSMSEYSQMMADCEAQAEDMELAYAEEIK